MASSPTPAQKKGKHVYLHQPVKDFQGASDEEIWNSFKNNNPEAFRHLYSTHFSKLFNYGCQFTQDQEVVKDLIQDMFIDLNEKKSKLADVQNIKFYLFKSLKRRMMKLFKRQHLPHSPNFFRALPPFAISVSHESTLIADEITRAQSEALEKAYACLTERQREVLLYYFYEGLGYEEITELMGFAKMEHARKLVYRSVVKLRKEMKGKSFLLLGISSIAVVIFYFLTS